MEGGGVGEANYGSAGEESDPLLFWRARRGFEHTPPTIVIEGVEELVEALLAAWREVGAEAPVKKVILRGDAAAVTSGRWRPGSSRSTHGSH